MLYDGRGTGDYTLYEDDGESMAYRRGACSQTIVNCEFLQDGVEVSIEERATMITIRRENGMKLL